MIHVPGAQSEQIRETEVEESSSLKMASQREKTDLVLAGQLHYALPNNIGPNDTNSCIKV